MPSSSDLARLITAFYNTRGGAIIFGIEDDTRRPVGVSNPQGVETGIVNIIRDRCSLDVMPSIEFVSYRGMEFVVVACPQGTHKSYLVSGEMRPYVRVGSNNREAQDEEIRRLYIEGSAGGFEGMPCRSATPADLSTGLITGYIRRRDAVVVTQSSVPDPPHATAPEMKRKWKCMSPSADSHWPYLPRIPGYTKTCPRRAIMV